MNYCQIWDFKFVLLPMLPQKATYVPLTHVVVTTYLSPEDPWHLLWIQCWLQSGGWVHLELGRGRALLGGPSSTAEAVSIRLKSKQSWPLTRFLKIFTNYLWTQLSLDHFWTNQGFNFSMFCLSIRLSGVKLSSKSPFELTCPCFQHRPSLSIVQAMPK